MTNIEKLYELAGITCKDLEFCKDCIYLKDNLCVSKQEFVEECLPFTANKQLELIKFIEKIDWVDCLTTYFYAVRQLWVFIVSPVKEFSNEQLKYFASEDKDFSQALSGLIIELWNDLTEQQRNEIKEILK